MSDGLTRMPPSRMLPSRVLGIPCPSVSLLPLEKKSSTLESKSETCNVMSVKKKAFFLTILGSTFLIVLLGYMGHIGASMCFTTEPRHTNSSPTSSASTTRAVGCTTAHGRSGDGGAVVINAEGWSEDGMLHLKRTKKRLPKAIIVGVRKAGTRALLEMLNLHPKIAKASSEVHYFDIVENYEKGLDWYRHQMPYSYPDQITIEKSPAYFITEETPQRIYQMNNTMKLLLIVRDPTERAISDYTQIYSHKQEKNKNYDRFEDLALDPETKEVNTHYKAIRTSVYHRHMAQWLKYFPLEQICVVDGDKLVKDPLPELQRVETFLGLERYLSNKNLYYNASRGFYCLRNDTMNKCLSDSKGRQHPDVDPKVVAKLHHYFRQHNKMFYQMVQREFDWP
ncbi:HS3ST5 [Branchiostoma lanceolatum]|uniref:Sulfotransferase n=1 Tax=Branchiostoma lanceolatum TaxID=7740 RepID=A0A8J9ZIC5_BRALA|nr:HS3ST5 [Branchiostoma lanceolatum]